MFASEDRRTRATIRRVLALPLAAAVCASLASAAHASTSEPLPFTPELRARYDALLDGATHAGDGASPAVAVALVENGALVYARAAGSSDVATGAAATTATRFRAGALTKMFTAVAVLQLIEDGRVKIDEPLITYLPSAPHAKDVTIRQLLSHTAGYPEYASAALAAGLVYKPTTPQGILDTIAAEPLQFTPGHEYRYSNTNYVLLGLLVESVVRQPLATYERENILERAVMKQTTFGAAEAGSAPATGYVDGKPAARPFDPTWLYAADDVVTTASDLARFDIALMSGKLIAPATLAGMTRAEVRPDPGGGSYGLGLTLRAFGSDALAGQNGGLAGFEAVDEMLPAQHFGIVVLGNSSGFKTDALELPILKSLLPTEYAAFVAAQQRRAERIAASADPKITAALRGLIAGLQHGTIDRGTLSTEMNAAFTADTLVLERAQFTKLGPLKTLVFRGKSFDAKYLVYDYNGTFANELQTVPLRLVFDTAGKIEGFYQK